MPRACCFGLCSYTNRVRVTCKANHFTVLGITKSPSRLLHNLVRNHLTTLLSVMSTETTLTFNGIVQLIPDVLIDNFQSMHENNSSRKNATKYCFISHAHSDHYRGLSKQITRSDSLKFIMTRTTKELILSHSNTPTSMKINLAKVVFAEMNVTEELEPGLTYTFIPNYHCLGSEMILIKDGRKAKSLNVLYSGDARFENSVLYSIRTSSILSPLIFEDELIDMLYLDTTFSYRSRNIEILENLQGIYELVRLIRQYPIGTSFRFLDMVYGFEEVWVKIHNIFAKTCNFKICRKALKWIEKPEQDYNVPSDDLERNVNVVDKIHKLISVNRDTFDYTFYFGDIKEFGVNDDSSIVTIKHAIDLTQSEYIDVYLPKQESQFEELSCLNQERSIWNGKFLFSNSGEKHLLEFKYLKTQHSTFFFPLHVKFIYSRHSPYRETKNFVELFGNKIKDIYPMTESFDTWQKGFDMKNFYGINDSSYDKISHDCYGSCNIYLRSNEDNLRILNYWGSLNEKCSAIFNSFNSVSTEVYFDFDPFGQVLRGDETNFNERKKQGSSLKGRVMKTQRREKRMRIKRFLQNTAQFINIKYGIEEGIVKKSDKQPTEVSYSSNVMTLRSDLEDILTDINLM